MTFLSLTCSFVNDDSLDDEWIIDRKLEYIDRLDHESDLYKDYYLKLSKEKKSKHTYTA
ncbi:MAG: hypothetical protein IJ149_02440 [Oscillospiraceae bacterium]|nr:hypothetical protein [Oscillospiraceae bacterium]